MRKVEGMRHFPGSGPQGRTCRECRHFNGNRATWTGKDKGVCSEAARLTGRAVPFDRTEPACIYFTLYERPTSPPIDEAPPMRARSMPIDHTLRPQMGMVNGEWRPVALPPEIREFYRAWYSEMWERIDADPDPFVNIHPSDRLYKELYG